MNAGDQVYSLDDRQFVTLTSEPKSLHVEYPTGRWEIITVAKCNLERCRGLLVLEQCLPIGASTPISDRPTWRDPDYDPDPEHPHDYERHEWCRWSGRRGRQQWEPWAREREGGHPGNRTR